jgi:hypothetical protein
MLTRNPSRSRRSDGRRVKIGCVYGSKRSTAKEKSTMNAMPVEPPEMTKIIH